MESFRSVREALVAKLENGPLASFVTKLQPFQGQLVWMEHGQPSPAALQTATPVASPFVATTPTTPITTTSMDSALVSPEVSLAEVARRLGKSEAEVKVIVNEYEQLKKIKTDSRVSFL